MPTKKLQNKFAVITGGNSGIGLAAAILFREEGASIAFLGRDQKTVSETAAKLGGESLGVVGDVTSSPALDSFYQQVKERFGKIDVLFVNAGVSAYTPTGKVTEEFYDRIFNINVKGAFFTVQKALPLMTNGSSIIFTTSVTNQLGIPGSAVYGASKAAVRAFTRVMAAELLSRGIRVNAVSPGSTETPIVARRLKTPEEVAAAKIAMANANPMKRLATAEEVAKAVLFLASEDSSFTTGEEIMVDGGLTQF
jgi:NAD(P)-dependent dehydrogenase (short-subunit alcohol dehydrogenase family)